MRKLHQIYEGEVESTARSWPRQCSTAPPSKMFFAYCRTTMSWRLLLNLLRVRRRLNLVLPLSASAFKTFRVALVLRAYTRKMAFQRRAPFRFSFRKRSSAWLNDPKKVLTSSGVRNSPLPVRGSILMQGRLTQVEDP